MTASAERTPGTHSRRRKLEPESERRLITKSAHRVLRRNGFAEANVVDILREAGLSTRAFYRHFQSKDDVLLAVYREDSAVSAQRLADRVAAADSPVGALEAWLDEFLAIAFDRSRASWATLFTSSAARRAVGYPEEEAAAAAAAVAPLAAAIRAGVHQGVFDTATPEDDARSVHALTWSLVQDQLRDPRFSNKKTAKQHVLRFVLPALRATS